MQYDVFLCYSARDQATADRVCHALEGSGIRCWLASRDIEPGQNWGGAIVDAIGRCRLFVILFSAHANRSQQVLREVERAVNRRMPIVPFRIEPVTPSRDMEYYLSATHWLEATAPPLEPHLARLTVSIQRQLAAAPATARPPATLDALRRNYLEIGRSLLQPSTPRTGSETDTAVTVERRAQRSVNTGRRRRRLLRRWWIVPATVALTLATVALTTLVSRRLQQDRADARAAATPQVRTLAVLPFVNLGPDAGDDYFSDGITQEILNKLSQLQGLRVAASTSSFYYKGRSEDVRLVGAALGVGLVLEGSVRKAGDRLRVTAQLINVQDGYRVWSQEYDRAVGDIFAVQDEIARAIARSLELRFAGAADLSHGVHPTGDHEAYDLFLRGRHLISPYVQERNDKAIAYLQDAVKRDPSFALAYAALARAYIAGAEYKPPRHVLQSAKQAALRALELDSSQVETRLALADVLQVYDRDWGAAERELRRALALDSASAAAPAAYADFLLDARRFEEARLQRQRSWELRRAQAPDTLLPAFRIEEQISWASYNLYAGKTGEALQHTQAALELDPSNATARWLLSIVYLRMNRPTDAVVELEKLSAENQRALPIYTHLGSAYAAAGRKTEARAVLDTLHARAARQYLPKDQIALIHLALGEKAEALTWLERAIDDYHWWMPNTNAHPLWAEFRDDPRFRELMRQVGAPTSQP